MGNIQSESSAELPQFGAFSSDEELSPRRLSASSISPTKKPHTVSSAVQPVVTGYFTDPKSGHVMYTIEVPGRKGRLTAYSVKRRLSEFRKLYRHLEKVVNGEHPTGSGAHLKLSPHDEGQEMLLPSFPEDSVLYKVARYGFGYKANGFMVDRIKKLQEILNIAISHPKTRDTDIIREFLGKPPDDAEESRYVSFEDYAVPRRLSYTYELRERRRLAAESPSSIGMVGAKRQRKKRKLQNKVKKASRGQHERRLEALLSDVLEDEDLAEASSSQSTLLKGPDETLHPPPELRIGFMPTTQHTTLDTFKVEDAS